MTAKKILESGNKKKAQKNHQFICNVCGEGFDQKSRMERHIMTSHPKPAPSAADLEKILKGIDYPATKQEIVNYTKEKVGSSYASSSDMEKDETIQMVKSLPTRNYRDAAEIAKAFGEIKKARGIMSKEEAEEIEQPSKNGGMISAHSSISGPSIASLLSGIEFPKTKEEIKQYIKTNTSKYKEKGSEHAEIDINKVLYIIDKMKPSVLNNMADVEKEIGKIL